MPNSPKPVPNRFLLDENIPKSVKRLLESRGFSVEYEEKGARNGELASAAKRGGSVLVSRDSDFVNDHRLKTVAC